MREFYSLDNPKNAQTYDDDDQPEADESVAQVTSSSTLHLNFENGNLL